ncbi:MAG: hypothetical protein KDA21_15330, partial [Phycisphaerales bacterium]|nr:hypothetical protein [Phycisphaerales bacterium]
QSFLDLGGYDPAFGYYVEEYDLCARLIRHDQRIIHSRAITFEHRKVTAGRDFGDILYRLVRNNAWVMARYAPDEHAADALQRMLSRYEGIARRENVIEAWQRARADIDGSLSGQPRTPLSEKGWRRLTGAAAVAAHLVPALRRDDITSVHLIAEGKGADVIAHELTQAGIRLCDQAPTAVIGTLSPGPLLDALARDPDACAPWSLRHHDGILARR